MKRIHSLSLPLSALVAMLLAAPAFTAEDVAATLKRYNIQEHTTRVNQDPLWRKPAKVMVLDYGLHPGYADKVRAAVGNSVELVVVKDSRAAAAASADVDVIIGANPEICDMRIVNNATRVRWLASLSAGVENCMNLPIVQSRGVILTNMRGVDSPVIAEHAIGMMLALAHGLEKFAVDTSQGVWARGMRGGMPIQYMGGKTLLISGLGGIGNEIARRAHALDMNVVGTRVGGTGKPDYVSYIGQPDELLKLARTADVIISAVPLTPETTKMYNKEFFAVLKPTAFFINTARGGSVDTDALLAALNEKRLAGAGLDVTDPEPLPPNHPLWKAPRVLITPHVGGRSDVTDDARWTVAIENLRRYIAGEKILNKVDLALGF